MKLMKGRYSGKTAVLIHRTVASGGVILVATDERRKQLLELAAQMGLPGLNVIVMKRSGSECGVTFAGVLTDK